MKNSYNCITKIENNEAKMQLFIFHHAGGSSANYKNLAKKFSNLFEIILVDLPGRGKRFQELMPETLNEIIEDLAYPISQTICKPFVFFGHSLGSHISYRILAELEREFYQSASLFFPSGANSPSYVAHHGFKSTSRSSFLELLYDLIYLGGVSKEFMKDEVMVQHMVNLYRLDLKIFDDLKNYEIPILSCPIISLGSNKDNVVNPAALYGWSSVTRSYFESQIMDGNHFYIYDQEFELVSFIKDRISNLVIL